MAGHSKWHNIQQRKNAQDSKRGKIFMRHAKAIYTAAKHGGGDMEMNPQLRAAVEKAKSENVPNDNIERAIQKATGTLDGARFEEITYEGYGPGGVAVIVHALSDNKNRTAGEIRNTFNKHGGNLGENGSVTFMFNRKGYMRIMNESGQIDEETLTLHAIEAGAEDIRSGKDFYEIYTTPEDFQDVGTYLEEAGFTLSDEEVTFIPQTYNQISASEEEKMLDMIDTLEENEDVQDVVHNLELSK